MAPIFFLFATTIILSAAGVSHPAFSVLPGVSISLISCATTAMRVPQRYPNPVLAPAPAAMPSATPPAALTAAGGTEAIPESISHKWADLIYPFIIVLVLILILHIIIVSIRPSQAFLLKLKCGEFININGDEAVWNEGDKGRVTHIFIWHTKYINGIRIIYERNNNIIISDMHGSDIGNLQHVCVKGGLTWMKGYYHNIDLGTKVTSLTFGNEKHIYGPFGKENGIEFSYIGKEEITGFHGWDNISSVKYIGAINPYIKFTKKKKYF